MESKKSLTFMLVLCVVLIRCDGHLRAKSSLTFDPLAKDHCEDDEDCHEEECCMDNECFPEPECKKDHCESDDDCPNNDCCLLGKCHPEHDCPNCDNDFDCSVDQCCNTNGHCASIDQCERPRDCLSESDCPNHYCCSIYGHCGTDPEFCHDTFPCTSDSDCTTKGECCSDIGHCGLAPEYCDDPTTVAPPTTTTKEPQLCFTDFDCTGEDECCSQYGHCGTGPEYCDWKSSSVDPKTTTTQRMTTTINICDSDLDCPPSAPCCSSFGHCGDGAEFCTTTRPTTATTTTTPATTTTTTPATTTTTTAVPPPTTTSMIYCHTTEDCPIQECCSPYGHCGLGSEFCGGDNCKVNCCVADDTCGENECCSSYGNCGSGPEFCYHPGPGPTTHNAPTTTTGTSKPVECATLKDCPGDRPWCCDENFCVAVPRECGDGECMADEDCPQDGNEKYCCSQWGYCGTGDEYCNDVKVDECTTPSDCPGEMPWCCDKGFCAAGPKDCNDGECITDADCHPGECCSIYGYCGTDPNYCKSTTTMKPTTTTGNGECYTLNDCPEEKQWCCDKNFCVADPAECGDGECTVDADCPPNYCCSEYGYCGLDAQYCN